MWKLLNDIWWVVGIRVDVEWVIIGFSVGFVRSGVQVEGHLEEITFFEVGLDGYLQSKGIEYLDYIFPYPVWGLAI